MTSFAVAQKFASASLDDVRITGTKNSNATSDAAVTASAPVINPLGVVIKGPLLANISVGDLVSHMGHEDDFPATS